MEAIPCFVPTSLFLRRKPLRCHQLPAQRTRTRVLRIFSGPTPKVKSSYYKNPSKAIEKGGGFYIPGLRGPRLRVAVSALAVTLLTVNHFSIAATAIPQSLRISESIALTATIGILFTALVDISNDREAQSPDSSSYSTTVQRSSGTSQISASASTGGAKEIGDEASWEEAVCSDLTNATAFAICRDGEAFYASSLAKGTSKAGAAVARVAKEKRAVYIDDTSALPPEINLPFLPDGKWAVYLVPNDVEVVAFATKGSAGFDKRQRDWLEQFAFRMARGRRD